MERLRASPVYQAMLHGGAIPGGMGVAATSPAPSPDGAPGHGDASAAGRVLRSFVAALHRPWYVAGMTTGLAVAALVVLMVSRPAERVLLPSETDWLSGGSEITGLRGEPPPSTGGSHESPEQPQAKRAETDLLRAVEAYSRRDLGPAIPGLRSAQTTWAEESIRLIYLGNALAHQGDFPEAIRILQTALHKNLPNAWREEGRWTLLVAFNRTGQRASADSLLRLLASQPGEVGGRVRALLSKHGSKDFR